MPVLQKKPDELTWGEAVERLKKNPNDPDPRLKIVRESNQRFAKTLKSMMENPIGEIRYVPRSQESYLAEQNGLLRKIIEQGKVKETPNNKFILADIYPPNNRKFKTPRKIVTLLQENRKVDVFYIAQCIYPGLTRKDFAASRKAKMEKVENRIRLIRKKVATRGYLISIKSGYCELIARK